MGNYATKQELDRITQMTEDHANMLSQHAMNLDQNAQNIQNMTDLTQKIDSLQKIVDEEKVLERLELLESGVQYCDWKKTKCDTCDGITDVLERAKCNIECKDSEAAVVACMRGVLQRDFSTETCNNEGRYIASGDGEKLCKNVWSARAIQNAFRADVTSKSFQNASSLLSAIKTRLDLSKNFFYIAE